MTVERARVPNETVAQHPPSPSTEMRTIGELFNELSEDFSHLVRQEVHLARTETMESLNQAKRGSILMVAAGLLGYAGFIALLVAIADLLNTAIGVYWISSLIVGVAVLIVAAILYFAGRSALSNVTVVPEKTIETLKNDAQWAKEQVR